MALVDKGLALLIDNPAGLIKLHLKGKHIPNIQKDKQHKKPMFPGVGKDGFSFNKKILKIQRYSFFKY